MSLDLRSNQYRIIISMSCIILLMEAPVFANDIANQNSRGEREAESTLHQKEEKTEVNSNLQDETPNGKSEQSKPNGKSEQSKENEVYENKWLTAEISVPNLDSEDQKDMKSLSAAKEKRISEIYGDRISIGLDMSGLIIIASVFPKDGKRKTAFGGGGSLGFAFNCRLVDPEIKISRQNGKNNNNNTEESLKTYKTIINPSGAHMLYLTFGSGATALGLTDQNQDAVSMNLGITAILGLRYDYVWFQTMK